MRMENTEALSPLTKVQNFLVKFTHCHPSSGLSNVTHEEKRGEVRRSLEAKGVGITLNHTTYQAWWKEQQQQASSNASPEDIFNAYTRKLLPGSREGERGRIAELFYLFFKLRDRIDRYNQEQDGIVAEYFSQNLDVLYGKLQVVFRRFIKSSFNVELHPSSNESKQPYCGGIDDVSVLLSQSVAMLDVLLDGAISSDDKLQVIRVCHAACQSQVLPSNWERCRPTVDLLCVCALVFCATYLFTSAIIALFAGPLALPAWCAMIIALPLCVGLGYSVGQGMGNDGSLFCASGLERQRRSLREEVESVRDKAEQVYLTAEQRLSLQVSRYGVDGFLIFPLP